MQAPPPARSSPSVTRTISRTCRQGGCNMMIMMVMIMIMIVMMVMVMMMMMIGGTW